MPIAFDINDKKTAAIVARGITSGRLSYDDLNIILRADASPDDIATSIDALTAMGMAVGDTQEEIDDRTLDARPSPEDSGFIGTLSAEGMASISRAISRREKKD